MVYTSSRVVRNITLGDGGRCWAGSNKCEVMQRELGGYLLPQRPRSLGLRVLFWIDTSHLLSCIFVSTVKYGELYPPGVLKTLTRG
jgi:hypothetical protein